MNDALENRIKAKKAMDKAKDQERVAKDVLLGLFVVNDLEKLKCNLGTLSYTKTDRSTINKDLLVQELANEGLSVNVINKVVRRATKTSTSEGVTFRMKK